MLKVETTIAETRAILKQWKAEGLSIGFVPTMGYLHEGHGSLLKEARAHHDKVVASIFVNPTQFAPNEDLASYPRDLESDKALCQGEGVDLIFAPTPEEMYPTPSATTVSISGITQGLCGASRPTHFDGVALVVSKLFHIIPADAAYFGEKDAQQLAVIKKMVADLNMDIKIVGCPIIREADGLAKSSRNSYLSPTERKAALILSQALAELKSTMESGEKSVKILLKQLSDKIATEPLATLDYGEIVDTQTLEPVEEITAPVLVALAVKIGNTRLIDNFTYEGEKHP